MNLATLIAQRAETQAEYEASLDAVCRIATAAGALAEVARLQGFRRELQILCKQELELIAHGRTETRSDAPPAQSAPETPAKLTDAE